MPADNERAGRPNRDALRAHARKHAIPVSASLELTKRCNLECYHCYVAGGHSELTTERWLHLLGELEAEGCLHITLTGGEAALRSDWLVIAARVKDLRMTLTVLTNGTAFAPGDLEALAALRPFLVQVSLYGAGPETHDAVTGVPGTFDRSVATLRSLRLLGVRCRIACTLMPATLPEVPRIVELAASIDCEYQFDPTVVPRSDGDEAVLVHRLSADGVREFYSSDRILKKTAEGQLALLPGELPPRTMGNCAAGITSLNVEANGDVVACMGLPPVLGNIADTSFRDIWRGTIAEEHRQRMSEPLVACAACDLNRICTVRCPRLAWHESGSLSGKSSRACDLAEVNVSLRQAVWALQRES